MLLTKDWQQFTPTIDTLIFNPTQEQVFFKTTIDQVEPMLLIGEDTLFIKANYTVWLKANTRLNVSVSSNTDKIENMYRVGDFGADVGDINNTTGTTGITLFTNLQDTPNDYENQANKFLAVNETEDGIAFVELDVNEVPDYTPDDRNKVLAIDDNGIPIWKELVYECKNNTFIRLNDTPSYYEANKVVAVNSTGDGITYVDVAEIANAVPDTDGHTDGEVLTIVDGTPTWSSETDDFISLTDTPNYYDNGKFIKVDDNDNKIIYSTVREVPNPEPSDDGKVLTVQDGSFVWSETNVSNNNFTELSDTPTEYTNNENKLVAVNSSATGLEFIDKESVGTTEFKNLVDTPTDYVGYSGKVVAVKSTEDGLEFVEVSSSDIPEYTEDDNGKVLSVDNSGNLVWQELDITTDFKSLTDTPADYTDQANKFVVVKDTEDGLDFAEIVNENDCKIINYQPYKEVNIDLGGFTYEDILSIIDRRISTVGSLPVLKYYECPVTSKINSGVLVEIANNENTDYHDYDGYITAVIDDTYAFAKGQSDDKFFTGSSYCYMGLVKIADTSSGIDETTFEQFDGNDFGISYYGSIQKISPSKEYVLLRYAKNDDIGLIILRVEYDFSTFDDNTIKLYQATDWIETTNIVIGMNMCFRTVATKAIPTQLEIQCNMSYFINSSISGTSFNQLDITIDQPIEDGWESIGNYNACCADDNVTMPIVDFVYRQDDGNGGYIYKQVFFIVYLTIDELENTYTVDSIEKLTEYQMQSDTDYFMLLTKRHNQMFYALKDNKYWLFFYDREDDDFVISLHKDNVVDLTLTDDDYGKNNIYMLESISFQNDLNTLSTVDRLYKFDQEQVTSACMQDRIAKDDYVYDLSQYTTEILECRYCQNLGTNQPEYDVVLIDRDNDEYTLRFIGVLDNTQVREIFIGNQIRGLDSRNNWTIYIDEDDVVHILENDSGNEIYSKNHDSGELEGFTQLSVTDGNLDGYYLMHDGDLGAVDYSVKIGKYDLNGNNIWDYTIDGTWTVIVTVDKKNEFLYALENDTDDDGILSIKIRKFNASTGDLLETFTYNTNEELEIFNVIVNMDYMLISYNRTDGSATYVSYLYCIADLSSMNNIGSYDDILNVDFKWKTQPYNCMLIDVNSNFRSVNFE